MCPSSDTDTSNHPLEIERKFLIDELPDNLDAQPFDDIEQGYVVIGSDGSEVRLRRKGDRYYETIKSSGTLARTEYEIELTRDQFDALWPASEGRRIEKTRHEIPHGSSKIELDVFRGKLAGLMTAEVEFDSERASEQFVAPPWFGRELTDDALYKNKNLAIHGIPEGA